MQAINLTLSSNNPLPTAGRVSSSQPINRDEAQDTLQAMRLLSLWQTPPTQSETATLLNVCENLGRPMMREDGVYWVGRLLQHFPSRQTERDAIVISDLAADLEGLSHCAVIESCDQLRREATADNPFLPPAGEIMKRVRERAKTWAERKVELSRTPTTLPTAAEPQKLKEVPWASMNYKTVCEKGLLEQVEIHCQTKLHGEKRETYGKYLRTMCGWHSDVIVRICA